MIDINKPTIRTCLEDLFAVYQDRIEAFPALTFEAQKPNIERMKNHAVYWNSLKELYVALLYITKTEDTSILDEFIFNWDNDFDEQQIRQVLNFALQIDWSEVGVLPADIHQHIWFVDMPPLEWKETNKGDRL